MSFSGTRVCFEIAWSLLQHVAKKKTTQVSFPKNIFVVGIIEREPEHDLLVIFIVVASPSVLIL